MNGKHLIPVLGAWLCLVSLPPALSAPAALPAGSIEGRVLHVAAGAYLRNAQVRVEGTTVETFTNDIGEYRLTGLPPGPVTLTVSFADMRAESERVTVESGRTITKDFNLVIDPRLSAKPTPTPDKVVVLDAFSVSERALSAEASAIQEQKIAPNIKNVVTFEEFGDLGEGNPGEFLKFVPGIEISQNPAVAADAAIRGMPSSGTLLLYDGVQFASQSADSRGADLVGANVGNIERIEITKVPTPDMPANAVGGMINVIPKSNLSLTRRALNYNLFATHSTTDTLRRLGSHLGEGAGTAYRHSNRSATQPGFDLTYMHPVNKSLALSLSAGYSDRVEIREILAPTWNLANNIQTAFLRMPLTAPRTRRLLASTADYKLGSQHRFSIRMQYTDDQAFPHQPQHTYNYGSGVTGGPDFSQGTANANGSVTQSVGHNGQIRQAMNGRFGYNFTGATWRANFTAGLSRSQFHTTTLEDGIFRTVTATLSGLVLRADNLRAITEQRPPVITARTAAGSPIDTANVNLFTLGNATGTTNPLKSNQQMLKLDVTRDLRLGTPVSLKAGVAYDHTGRDIRNQTFTWTINPPASAGGRLVGNYDLVDTAFSNRRPLMDGSKIQYIESRKVYRLYQDHPEYFQLNEATAYTSGINGSKLLDEAISAAYLRGDMKFFANRLSLVGGVRFERTDDDGRGPLNDPNALYQRNADGTLVRGANGRPVPVAGTALQLAQLQYRERSTRARSHYSGYYPSLNSVYTVTPDILVRAAYARTIGRPEITAILPGVTVTDLASTTNDPVITETNVGLKPWHADNWDLSLESYTVKGVTASVSLFRKEVTGFFTAVQRPASPADLDRYGLGPEYADYDIVTADNSSDGATVNGVELSWRQSLRSFAFVPEWAKGLQFYANLTRLNVSGPGADNFLPFRPKLFNWGASYTANKGFIRVNVAQQGPQRTAVLATNATTPAGSYAYIAIRIITDVAFEYRLNKRLALYGAARNLFQNPRRQLRSGPDTPDYARVVRYDNYGVLLTAGIKGTF